MSLWWRRRAQRAKPRSDVRYDQALVMLTARADQILEELDGVVKQMSDMLMDTLEDKQ